MPKRKKYKDPVLQIFNERTTDVVNIDRNEKFRKDSNNNKIIKGTFRRIPCETNIFLAHYDLVIPTYLIEIEEKMNINNFIYDVLKNILDVNMFKTPTYPTTDNKFNLKV